LYDAAAKLPEKLLVTYSNPQENKDCAAKRRQKLPKKPVLNFFRGC